MEKFYVMENDELIEYIELYISNQMSYKNFVKWVVFRKKHPFISWLVQTVIGFIYQSVLMIVNKK